MPFHPSIHTPVNELMCYLSPYELSIEKERSAPVMEMSDLNKGCEHCVWIGLIDEVFVL